MRLCVGGGGGGVGDFRPFTFDTSNISIGNMFFNQMKKVHSHSNLSFPLTQYPALNLIIKFIFFLIQTETKDKLASKNPNEIDAFSTK